MTDHVFDMELVKVGKILNIFGWSEEQIQESIHSNLPVNTACWYCCHHFEYAPVRLPYNKALRGGLNYYHSMGVFCSWNCAKAYQLHTYKGKVNYNISILANRVRHLLPGEKSNAKNAHVLKTAPERNLLQMFGGNLSIEEFRSGFMTLTGDIIGTDLKLSERDRRQIRADIKPPIFLDSSLLSKNRYSSIDGWLLNVNNGQNSSTVRKRGRQNEPTSSIQSIYDKMVVNQRTRESDKNDAKGKRSKMSKLICKKSENTN